MCVNRVALFDLPAMQGAILPFVPLIYCFNEAASWISNQSQQDIGFRGGVIGMVSVS